MYYRGLMSVSLGFKSLLILKYSKSNTFSEYFRFTRVRSAKKNMTTNLISICEMIVESIIYKTRGEGASVPDSKMKVNVRKFTNDVKAD